MAFGGRLARADLGGGGGGGLRSLLQAGRWPCGRADHGPPLAAALAPLGRGVARARCPKQPLRSLSAASPLPPRFSRQGQVGRRGVLVGLGG